MQEIYWLEIKEVEYVTARINMALNII